MNKFFFQKIISTPSHKEILKIYSCGVLVWNDPIGLHDIVHKCKTDICVTCGLCVISSVSNYILLEMALLSEHLQTDVFESNTCFSHIFFFSKWCRRFVKKSGLFVRTQTFAQCSSDHPIMFVPVAQILLKGYYTPNHKY